MNGLGLRKGALVAALTALLVLVAATAAEAAPVNLTVTGIKGKSPMVLDKVRVEGQLEPATAGPVDVQITVGDQKPETQQVHANSAGKFEIPITVTGCCAYKISATTATGATGGASFNVRVPHLKKGSKGPLVKLFHNKLIEQGFYVRKSKRFGFGTELAILAFRKTNKMHRSHRYSGKIFRMLLQGRGAFPLQHPDEGPDGKHVEVDLSRQVMTLAEDGAPKHTFHISSGAGGTPTVTGKFHFYMKVPGYNAKHMYYSVFFIGGYATHGYSPVPNYPASHGCVRNPVPYSRFIYNWINIGDPIWVYH